MLFIHSYNNDFFCLFYFFVLYYNYEFAKFSKPLKASAFKKFRRLLSKCCPRFSKICKNSANLY